MAAVTTPTTFRPVSVPGYEVNQDGAQAGAAITKGQLLILSGAAPAAGFVNVWVPATAAATEAHGIALMSSAIGQVAEVGIQGEADNFAGLTPGAGLYPSATIAGGIDTTPAAGAPTRVRAISATRIRFNFT